MTKVRLTESQLRRIIYEELLDSYLLQQELWSEDRQNDSPDQKQPRQMENKKGTSA